jgi:hypothetical protein
VNAPAACETAGTKDLPEESFETHNLPPSSLARDRHRVHGGEHVTKRIKALFWISRPLGLAGVGFAAF